VAGGRELAHVEAGLGDDRLAATRLVPGTSSKRASGGNGSSFTVVPVTARPSDGTLAPGNFAMSSATLPSACPPFASADVVYGILPSAGLEGEGLEGGAP